MSMTDAAAATHISNRLAFGPHPRAVETPPPGPAALVDELLSRAPLAFDPPGDIDHGFEHAPESVTDDSRLVRWWLQRMADPDAGIGDRMMWFWHTHFTTSTDKASTQLAWRQLRTIHRHALGSFAELLRVLITDGAMLQYLDGDGSDAAHPNENFSREVLELFTVGRGGYGEADVRAGARILAGWYIDWERSEVAQNLDQELTFGVPYLGRLARTVDDLVAAILGHPAAARFVADKIHCELVGVDPTDQRSQELATEFAAAGWSIAALVEQIVRHPSFLEHPRSRPKSAVEWVVSAAISLGLDLDDLDPWSLSELGQLPYHPPNVAGWPDRARWLSASQYLGRAGMVGNWELDIAEKTGSTADPVAVWLQRCGISDAGPATLEALRLIAEQTDDDWTRGVIGLRITVLTPEFSLS